MKFTRIVLIRCGGHDVLQVVEEALAKGGVVAKTVLVGKGRG